MRIPTEDSIKKNVTILELGDIKNYDMYAYMTSYYLYNIKIRLYKGDRVRFSKISSDFI